MNNMVWSLIDKNLPSCSDQVAVKKNDITLTYLELSAEVIRLHSALTYLSQTPGDYVLCFFSNSVDSLILILALIRAGMVPFIVNPDIREMHAKAYHQSVQAKLILYGDDLPDDCILNIKKYFPKSTSEAWLRSCINTNQEKVYECSSANAPAFGLFTSGSTGVPKAVIHQHKDLPIVNANYVDHVLKLQPGEVIYSTSKLFFAYGFNAACFALMNGCTVILADDELDKHRIFSRLIDQSVQIFFSVPTVYSIILNLVNKETRPLTTRISVSAGEQLPVGIQEKWYNLFGQRIIDGIGTTETLSTYISNSKDAYKVGSTGMLVPGFKAKIVPHEDQSSTTEKIGILYVRSEVCCNGYLNNSEQSRKQFIDDWFNTGDLFSKDAQGFYFYHGRVGHIFKYGGVWVYPYRIEQIIQNHHSVQDCVVTKKTDSNGLTRPVAIIVPVQFDCYQDKLAEDLKAYCKAKLGKWEYPHFVYFCRHLPKTATGKKIRLQMEEKCYEWSN